MIQFQIVFMFIDDSYCDSCGEDCLNCECAYTEKDATVEDFIGCVQWLYFDYMKNKPIPDYLEFKADISKAAEAIVEVMNERYCDHLEGLRRSYEHR